MERPLARDLSMEVACGAGQGWGSGADGREAVTWTCWGPTAGTAGPAVGPGERGTEGGRQGQGVDSPAQQSQAGTGSWAAGSAAGVARTTVKARSSRKSRPMVDQG